MAEIRSTVQNDKSLGNSKLSNEERQGGNGGFFFFQIIFLSSQTLSYPRPGIFEAFKL